MTNRTQPVSGRLVTAADVDAYRIDGLDAMAPFLVSVVSSTDLWMFASSRGALTAGRRDADTALLPYDTDDRLHRAAGVTGPVSMLARDVDGVRHLWQPFGPGPVAAGPRAMVKAVANDRLVLEESHPRWGLRHRTTWMPAPTLGWVRRVELINDGDEAVALEVLDGLLDVMPPGVDSAVERRASNLIDAYKRSETGTWGQAALYSLQAGITDRAEPSEALRATLVWSTGTAFATVHLDEAAVTDMHVGRPRTPARLLTGRQGAYLLRGAVEVPAGGRVSWSIVVDIGLGRPALDQRIALAGRPDADALIDADVASGAQRLRALLADADAVQHTGDPIADAHHTSNVLFNAMRGGVPLDGHHVDGDRVAEHLAIRNRGVHARHADLVRSLGARAAVTRLHEVADDTGDPDLRRLALEHLPLTFSRRHGDPSRPWNRFSIPPGPETGQQVVGFEGNWRDIFQNWEALLHAYPAWTPGVVATFVNASTADGHNPYRISEEGIDWEVPDPEDPWSNIGYWGDHQIVYLHRLLAHWQRIDPAAIPRWLQDPIFTYADVPYVLAGHDAIAANPRDTITYDTAQAARIAERVSQVGGDGRLLVDAGGELVRVGLLEKLLVPVLAKLCTFVPGGGIWMVTQRPEWNDANNALAGWGLSLVTLYHLHAHVAWLQALLDDVPGRSVQLSATAARWVQEVAAAIAEVPDAAHVEPAQRRVALDRLGRAGADHRQAVTSGFDPQLTAVDLDVVRGLLADALRHLRRTIAGARRDDGLYDAYRILSLPDDSTAEVGDLPLMLEGQAAILAADALDAEESLAVVEAMYDSPLLRADQQSFVLYPVTQPPGVLETNRFAVGDLPEDVPVDALVDAGVLLPGADGWVHVAAHVVNAEALRAALTDSDLDESQQRTSVRWYDRAFGHDRYMGRSGSMYGYEGIGSIYWHMVAKVLLAVQETHRAARDGDAESEVVAGLAAAYRRIRDGLGFRKDPADFGAVPIDCYSHTPAHAGAQQPGMTGQVKEEVLTRLGEIGIELREGRLRFSPGLLPLEELLPADGPAQVQFCGTMMRLRRGDQPSVTVHRADAPDQTIPGAALDEAATRAILARDGSVASVSVTLALPRR